MIKAIAVDMDGTFLNSQSTYDHQRFAKVFRQLQEHNIQFVVASGNPIYQLQMAFPDYVNDLCFVAENGVECFDHGTMILPGALSCYQGFIMPSPLKMKILNSSAECVSTIPA